ncbi:MAG: insulinase family protein [Ignavibacteriales bacterium]|nr:MAG: insulinase family protein [Ignavibacteriales bacterium]
MIKTLLISLLMIATMTAQKLVELKQPSSNKVVIKFMFLNGSVSDPSGKEGLTSTVVNTILQGGTGELSYSSIQEMNYPMASRYGASVDKEVSIFTFEIHNDWLEKFYPVMIGLVTAPSFQESDFNRVKTNQQNYVDQVIRASSDEEYSKKALEDFLFRGTKYQHMVQGKSESVKSITLNDVKTHYKTYFTSNNLTIGIAGNYSSEFVNKLMSDMKALPDTKPSVSEVATVPMPDGVRVEIISKDNAFGSAIYGGFPLTINRSSDDFAALMVANSYLGEHRKSYGRLYQQLREQRSMNYGDYSYIEWYENGGSNMLPPAGVPRSSNYFSIWIRPVQIAKQLQVQYDELKDLKLGHAHYAIRMAMWELDKLVKNGMSQEDFESTRKFLMSYIKLYVQTPSQQLGYLMDSKFYGREDYINELQTLLSELTLDDVNNVIKKYWQTENMYITIVTDKSEAEALSNSLLNNSDSLMSYSNIVKSGLPKELLEEDEIVAKFRMNVKDVKIINSQDTFK